jgi:hypothetical protein
MNEADLQKRRRSQRVLLQVSVLIGVQMSEGDRVQAQAFTRVVNAHGGLLESLFPMTAGQRITLINLRSGKEVGCRVLRVDGPSEGCFATAFEFDERSPQFWPIDSPPEDWVVT